MVFCGKRSDLSKIEKESFIFVFFSPVIQIAMCHYKDVVYDFCPWGPQIEFEFIYIFFAFASIQQSIF